MILKLREFIWPVLEKPTAKELESIKNSECEDIKNIQETDWLDEIDLALEEARRLASEEDDRRMKAESKASNLLMVAAALIPLLTYLETVIWDSSFGAAPTWLTLPLLAMAVAYLGNAGLWAFRTIASGNYHCVYPGDLVRIWRAEQPSKPKLLVDTLVAIRRNQETINNKVSASKMTHSFLLHAVISFSVLLLIRVGFGLYYILKQPVLEFIRCNF